MKLKTKLVNISAGGPLIALIHKDDATVLNIGPLSRLALKTRTKEITVLADVAYSKESVRPGEVGVFQEVAKELNLKNKQELRVTPQPSPESVYLIKKKLDKKSLSKKEIDQIVKDLTSNKLTEVEVTYFVSACYVNGMSLKEAGYLAEAIVRNSGRLHFKKHPIVDKHCVGGVAGNRTTMIVVPILAAAGITVPKTSSKSITSPAGTANTMEILAPVSFTNKEISRIVNKTNGCMVWGGTENLASADDKLIKLEKPLRLDPEGFLLASILAKKTAADASHVLIDIPIGKEAKIKNKKTALRLKRKFIKLGKQLGMRIKVIITDGSQPIGNGIGPALEARDVLLVLQNKGPQDLAKKSVKMAGILLSMVGVKNSYEKAEKILHSGLAYHKMEEIIKAQGGKLVAPEKISLGKYKYVISAKKSGKIHEIRNLLITRLAKTCGAPVHKTAGLYIHKKVNEKVKRNEPIITLYAESKDRLKYAIELSKKEKVILIK